MTWPWPDHNGKDNPSDLWHLGHWLQFWQLRTWIHDNLCYLTIKSDTGQHSQFLRCFVVCLFVEACLLLPGESIPKVWALLAWGIASSEIWFLRFGLCLKLGRIVCFYLFVCLLAILFICLFYNLKVWSLLEAEEDAAGLKMKETLEQLHQSGWFVENKTIKNVRNLLKIKKKYMGKRFNENTNKHLSSCTKVGNLLKKLQQSKQFPWENT